jgi:PhzF family phenazine biosynthesis protein
VTVFALLEVLREVSRCARLDLMIRRFQQVDVFTETAFRGNPLAVVVDAEGLSTDEMQQFANWTNLSETTFLLPPTTPDADYHVRIFTASHEMPFAGHPTLGSCHAWLRAGGVAKHADQVVQQCGVGSVVVRRDGDRLAFGAPPLVRSGAVDDATMAEIVDHLQVDPQEIVAAEWIDNGPGWTGVLLQSAEKVLNLRPRATGHAKIGVAGPYPPGSPYALEVRAFFPSNGVVFEDAVTGSLNASLAQWLIGTGRLTAPYVASQGTVMGRMGRIYVSHEARSDGSLGTVWVGGNTITCVEGTVDL